MKGTRLSRVVILAVAGMLVSYAAPAFADAAATYKAKCSLCHGADGKGDTPAGKKMGTHDFASPEIQNASDADLIAATTNGKNKMPAYAGKLSSAEIKDLVSYIRQFGKGK